MASGISQLIVDIPEDELILQAYKDEEPGGDEGDSG